MTKKILLTFTLLSCTAWMVAQSTPSSSASPDTSSGAASPSQTSPSQTSPSQTSQSQSAGQSGSMNGGSETTIRGCLNSSGGGYTLTDASGTTYQLQGDTSKLASHVNNEVEVKGTASGSSGAGSAGSSASAGSSTSGGAGSQMFNVTKVKKVSSSCSTSK